MPKHVILYIPGLGDHNLSGQQTALRLWKLYRVEVEICPIQWLVDESWDAKLQRIITRIDYHTGEGSTVSLLGISAGSTAALQAFAMRQDAVNTVALVCGKFQYPETVHPLRYKMNPSFHEAIMKTVPVLEQLTPESRQRIRSYRPIYDNFLPTRETTIPGVKSITTPSITHVGGIAYALTLGSWQIVRFLKNRS